jgi:catechol 2,3-dioxygenase-like lactoylglutathione lyase family enzyme
VSIISHFCSELERTISFYTEVVGMRLTRIVQNRDEPTSAHIFFDIGGDNNWRSSTSPKKGRRAPCAALAACIT